MKIKDLRIEEARDLYKGKFTRYFTLTQFLGVLILISFYLNYDFITYFCIPIFISSTFMMVLNLVLLKDNKFKYILYKNDKKSIPLERDEICKLLKIKEETFLKLLIKLRK